MGKVRILVVDDEAEICALTKKFLTRKNYDVLAATDEPAALEAIEKERPDLVLLDVRLGSISGIELLRKIKQGNNKDIKVIMVTALDDEEAAAEAKSLGAEDYITKPFTSDSLTKIIEKRLA